jgi:uncharacterized membrane protein HdeD (DUF308 family)
MSTDSPLSAVDPVKEVRRATTLSIVLGVLLVAAGVLGLMFVWIATLTTAILFAWLLLAGGVFALVDAWQRRGHDGFWASAITGVLNIATGVLILWQPAASILALTMLVAVFLLVGGMLRLAAAAAGRVPGPGWMALHGIVDVVLAVLIIATLPTSSLYVLGTLLSVSLLVDGIALAVLGAAAQRGLGMLGRVLSPPPRHV